MEQQRDPQSLSEARTLLQQLARRAGRRSSVQLPLAFVKGEAPPLSALLRGGRSGEVRMKVFLTYVMRATAAPYDTLALYPPHLAEALALPDPDTRGTRRIQEALRWLIRHGYLAESPGKKGGRQVRVLNPMNVGSSGSDQWPGRGEGRRYLTVPIELWTNGWICVMSGRALALYLVLKELTSGRDQKWADGPRRELYGLSPATWQRAAGELKNLGLLTVAQDMVRDDYAVKRLRNVYELHHERVQSLTPEQLRAMN